MEWMFFTSFGAVFLIVFGSSLIVFCIIKSRRRQPLFSAPVVVTTATQQVPFTPGPQMQQTTIYPNQTSYPMGQQNFAMPMPVTNQHSYPMSQGGYPQYPSGGAPYPPGPHESMNPPSYDQVVGTNTTTATTNEQYAKQAPYNPNFTG
ncbi:hypothetical protein Bhyg_07737 [Pseudolycoriella hygida]|uniref:Uncharacterized protein n=1 Tax=Pseudolycoriella hygida TaxID=35572 RepID=A0A9Q0N387_9DIPT|nr:hypothetical protein Bhyg_07737 [Pseudolycoriella hygida]